MSSWVPEGVSGAQMALDAQARPAVVARAYHAHHLSTLWILVPIGAVFGGLILLPAGIFMLDAYRFSRAKAEFRAALSD